MDRKIFLVLIMVFGFLIYFSCEKGIATESNPIIIDQIANLVGYWELNGNANDSSSNQNAGVVDGAILGTDRFGNENSSYYFDGVDDYITKKEGDGFDKFEAPETIFTFSARCIITEKTTG